MRPKETQIDGSRVKLLIAVVSGLWYMNIRSFDRISIHNEGVDGISCSCGRIGDLQLVDSNQFSLSNIY